MAVPRLAGCLQAGRCFVAAGILLLHACGSEETVTDCRAELHVDSAKLICPAFSVVYDFKESRTSIYDRDGRAVLRNATATYTVQDPGKPEERRITTYDVSDAEPFGGKRLGPKERHGSSVKFPLPPPPEETRADFGRQVSVIVSAGNPLGGFEQRFIGFTKKDFLLIYTGFSSGAKCPATLLSVSPLTIDGAQQPWSSARSGLFVAGRPEETSVGSPEPFYQIIGDLRSNRMLFTGVLREASEVREPKNLKVGQFECSIGKPAPRTTIAEPDVVEGLALRDRGRTGYSRWSVEQTFGGVILDTSEKPYSMAVLYLDLGHRNKDEVEGEFHFLRDRFKQDSNPGDFPFILP